MCLAFAMHVGAVDAAQWARTFGTSAYDGASSAEPTPDGGFLVAGMLSSGNFRAGDVEVLRIDPHGNVVWQRSFGALNVDYAQVALPTSDGGALVAAATTSFQPAGGWLLKLDATGNVVWQKLYGSLPRTVRELPSGDFLVAGIGGTATSGHAWVARLNASGDVLWQGATGPNGLEEGALDADPTPDGGFVVAGYTSAAVGAGDWDALVFKVDSAFNLVWQRTYGGAGSDAATGVRRTPDGGFVFVGSTTSAGAGFTDVWVVKLDANGSIVWQRTYGGMGGDSGTSVQVLGDGSIVVAGIHTRPGQGSTDALVMKLDANGQPLWARAFGGAAEDVALSVREVPGGGYVVAGFTQSFGVAGNDIWILRLDGEGMIPGCPHAVRADLAAGASALTSTALSGAVTPVTIAPVTISTAPVDNAVEVQTQCSYDGPPQVADVPALSGWMLVLLAALTGAVGMRARAR